VKRGNTRDRKTERPAEKTKQNQAIEAEMKKMRREMEELRQQMRRLKAEQGTKANRTNPENLADSPPPASAF
jgi:dynactin complex subunit